MTIRNRTPAVPRLLASASGPGIPAVFDVLFSGACLVCLAPIVLLIAMAIRIDSRGPICTRRCASGKVGDPSAFTSSGSFITRHLSPAAH